MREIRKARTQIWALLALFCLVAISPVYAERSAPKVGVSATENHPPPLTATEVALGGTVWALSAANDLELAQLIQASQGPNLIAHGFTALGDPVGLAVLHAIIYQENPQLTWRSAKAVVAALTITQALKVITGRARPDTPGSTGAYTGLSLSDAYQSMPSGHTTAAFAMARVLAKTDPKHAAAYYAGATLVGLSRVNLARHWPSDVVAGALIGLSIGRYF